MSDKDLSSFFKKTCFENLDKQILQKAFIHPSYAAEHSLAETENYERLEFLGDAVLKLAVSQILYKRFPESREGKLTNLRAILVSDDFLFNIAEDLDLKDYIILSKALEKDGGRNIPSISACVFEAFLGALFECGIPLERITTFLNGLYSKYLDNMDRYMPKFNSKALLQEYTQAKNQDRPVYELVSQIGKDNDSTFKVRVLYHNEELGEGVGKTKKQAEREAAYQACLKLNIGELENE